MANSTHARLYRSGGVIEALQLSHATLAEATFWTAGTTRYDEENPDPDMTLDQLRERQVLIVPTIEGQLHVKMNEYLIKDETGRFTSMPAAEFEETYNRFFEPRNGLINLPRNFRKHAGVV